MYTTATRPLLHAAATLIAFATLSAPAEAAEGAGWCPRATDIPSSDGDLDEATAATYCLVNAERTSRGLRPLRRDADLAQAAREHSADMVRHDFFSHTSPGGETLKDRVREAGYGKPGQGWRAGENLGWGTQDRASPNALVDAWLESSAHRRILLSSDYREIGVGVATGAPNKDAPGATYTLNVGVLR
jgi:uncharacterized protein YkwD